MMKKITFNLLVCSVLLSFMAKAQHISHTNDVTQIAPEVIFTKMLNTPEIKNQEVKLVIVTFAPGEISGAHRHPIPTIVYVLEGEIETTFEGKVTRLKQGDTFWEDPNGLHTEAKNLSADKPAKLLVYFIGDKKKPFLIPEKK